MSLKEEALLTGHTDRVWCVSWGKYGELASASGDGDVRVWGEVDGKWKCKQVLKEHSRTVRSVSWAHEGNMLACSSFDASISIWQRESPDADFEIISCLEGHENEVKAVSWNIEDKLLATCSRDKTVWIWERGEEGFDEAECVGVLTGHSQDVKFVRWMPNEDKVVSCSYDDTVKIWENVGDDDWECTQTLHGHNSTVWMADFSPDGQRMVTCSDDSSLIIWVKSPEGQFLKEATLASEHTRTIYAVAWSEHGILTASGDDAIRLFTPTPTPGGPPSYPLAHRVPHAHLADVNCVKWGPHQQAASCSDDGCIKIWKLAE
eukprot:TRINITY_DN7965_c0_g1_i1.p1 TRINITY_DN7965_c0_g1~~TRINITY_DN7965_c0_g1_i1.p1  ORF type:complete len:319 (+),score=66.29 TRINITY_DN7965_c0_g1_i1:46-1002(+)